MIFRCPYCRTPVQPGDQTCGACAQPILKRCPTCSEEISILATVCKYCGEESFRRAAEPEPRPVEREIVFLDEPSRSVAWEAPRGGVVSRWWRTMFEASFHPKRFMQSLPRDGGYGKPISYVFAFFVQALFVGVVAASLAGAGAALAGVRILPRHTLMGVGIVLAAIPLGYLGCALGTLLSTGFWHVMAKLAGGKGRFEESFRMVAYSSGVGAWGFVPGIGRVIEIVLGLRLLYHGFREVHGMSGRRAVLAILLPALLTLALLGGVAIAAILMKRAH